MDFIQSAINANKEIYELLNKNYDDSFFCYIREDDNVKGAGGDRSLSIDIKAEEIFVKYLTKFGRINSEESGIIGKGDNEIIIDPIDGSSNISSHFPYYGSSVSLKVDGKTIKSIVANLSNGDFFVNDEGEKYKSSLTTFKKNSNILCQNSKVGIVEQAYANPSLVSRLYKAKMKFRSPGAIALSLAYAKYVNFVIFADKHRIYDVDAGLHLCEDMHKLIKDDFILISRDKMIFDSIKLILEG